MPTPASRRAWRSARPGWAAPLLLPRRRGEGRAAADRHGRFGLVGLGFADFLVALHLTLGHGRSPATPAAGRGGWWVASPTSYRPEGAGSPQLQRQAAVRGPPSDPAIGMPCGAGNILADAGA